MYLTQHSAGLVLAAELQNPSLFFAALAARLSSFLLQRNCPSTQNILPKICSSIFISGPSIHINKRLILYCKRSLTKMHTANSKVNQKHEIKVDIWATVVLYTDAMSMSSRHLGNTVEFYTLMLCLC